VARIGRSGTIVVLMGVATRAAIAERLVAGGLPPETPVAAVTWGTRSQQRTVRTTLAGLGAADVEAPATIVVGEVAGLDLAWFERRPLLGTQVVVTRARHQAGELVEALREVGAEPIEAPVIEIADPADGGAALRQAAATAHAFDWVVFTSANAVDRFCALLPDARAFGPARVAAVGVATAAALARFGVRADLVPDRAVGEGLVEVFPGPDGAGRVLLPRAAAGREVVPDGLRAKGWDVEVVEAYRTVASDPGPDALAAARAADAIVFTSPSTVQHYLAAAGGPDAVPPVVVCIGPVTAEAARAAGLDVAAEAPDANPGGLVRALSAAAPARHGRSVPR
jgi:uroporphyrinogen III methyltransferase/synthase